MICLERKSSRSQEMNASIHQGLKEKLEKNTACFNSYKEAILWVNDTYKRFFKYSWFRKYLIKHFGTKLNYQENHILKKMKK